MTDYEILRDLSDRTLRQHLDECGHEAINHPHAAARRSYNELRRECLAEPQRRHERQAWRGGSR